MSPEVATIENLITRFQSESESPEQSYRELQGRGRQKRIRFETGRDSDRTAKADHESMHRMLNLVLNALHETPRMEWCASRRESQEATLYSRSKIRHPAFMMKRRPVSSIRGPSHTRNCAGQDYPSLSALWKAMTASSTFSRQVVESIF